MVSGGEQEVDMATAIAVCIVANLVLVGLLATASYFSS